MNRYERRYERRYETVTSRAGTRGFPSRPVPDNLLKTNQPSLRGRRLVGGLEIDFDNILKTVDAT